jgi:Holliday junction DNA helicase RuvA
VISKITGTVSDIHEEAITLDVGGFGYEVLVPGGLALRLRQHGAAGSELTLHTLEYIEGGASGGAMTPRLVGFIDPLDREFYRLLTSVKGLGPRKALKSLTIHIAVSCAVAGSLTMNLMPGRGSSSKARFQCVASQPSRPPPSSK